MFHFPHHVERNTPGGLHQSQVDMSTNRMCSLFTECVLSIYVHARTCVHRHLLLARVLSLALNNPLSEPVVDLE